MKLTEPLLRWAKRLPKGNIWKGKYRLVKPVTPAIAAMKRREFELEERNMFYLRNPYLTHEQELKHAEPFKHHEKFLQKHKEVKLKNWQSNRLLGDRFGFLKVSDKWE